jgi:hypothetical protein
MKIFIGFTLGFLVCAVLSTFFWQDTNSYTLGQEVQKVMGICEEKLPRNEKCTFMIVPESKLIYGESE